MTSADSEYKKILPVVILEEKNILKLSKLLGNLYEIWGKVGVDEVNRANQVWAYIFDLLKDISDEETGLYEEIVERVNYYQIKLLTLSEELLLPKPDEVVGTLIHKRETLHQKIHELSEIKDNRVKEFQELHSLDVKYCKMLGVPTHNISPTTGVPTEKDLEELRQHVNMLKEEKAHRHRKFFILKRELTTILEVTELTPETSLELEILTSKEDDLTLSNETFKILEEFVSKTKTKITQLEHEKSVLMEKLNTLWDVLKISNDDREKFLSKYTCCRVSSINAIKEEIARCEELKWQNIKQYVEALKDELQSLLEKCFVSNSLLLLSHFQGDEVDEVLLQSYDNEVAKWRKYYKDTEHIIQKILKRQELWNLMTVFENKANDPNRFKNRGGNLLQEERERRKLQKELPALENEIFLDIKNYEEQTGKKFLYFGENFKEFITKQLDHRIAQKDNEKKRQHQRSQENEPNSTKRTFGSTPKSAPSKLFKSSHGLAVYRTPSCSAVKQVPCTTAKMRANKLLVLRSGGSNRKLEMNILKEKCMNKAEASSSHNSTTYTDFAEKLNRSSRSSHRSSVLSSKKIVGTQISASKSKRKSGNVATQRSSRKQTNTSVNQKSNSSKLTPARGKSGLPFLI